MGANQAVARAEVAARSSQCASAAECNVEQTGFGHRPAWCAPGALRRPKVPRGWSSRVGASCRPHPENTRSGATPAGRAAEGHCELDSEYPPKGSLSRSLSRATPKGPDMDGRTPSHRGMHTNSRLRARANRVPIHPCCLERAHCSCAPWGLGPTTGCRLCNADPSSAEPGNGVLCRMWTNLGHKRTISDAGSPKAEASVTLGNPAKRIWL